MSDDIRNLDKTQRQHLIQASSAAADLIMSIMRRMESDESDGHPNSWWRKYNDDIERQFATLECNLKLSGIVSKK